MNFKPILQQLDASDFQKMLAACKNPRERFYLQAGRNDPCFEYHIDLPTDPNLDAQIEGLRDMAAWLADETRFPND
jgi:hypothetical protein